MSKFTREFKNGKHIFCKDNSVYMSVLPEDLGEFASCASAALAEQNSMAMSGAECKCGAPPEFRACGMPFNPSPRIEDFCINAVGVMKCGHPKACHSTHTTENQGE